MDQGPMSERTLSVAVLLCLCAVFGVILAVGLSLNH